MAALIYNGHLINDRGDDLNLTDMWKAAGSPQNKEPFNWERKEGKGFIEAVSFTHNLTAGQVIRKKAGKGGGTWAHWQIGIAYAKYLDHGFHMWANTAVREKMEGKSIGLDGDTLEMIRRTDGIARQLSGKVTAQAAQIDEMRDEIRGLHSELERVNTGLRRAGITAGQIWKQNGLPPLKCGTLWLGNRLAKMGAGMEFGQRADIGGKAVRLFDPDRSKHCMENGLLTTARSYVAERQGQGRLRLIPRE